MTSGAGLGGVGAGVRPALGAAFRTEVLRRGAVRTRALLAGRDFLAILRRAGLRADARLFEALRAAFFRRGAFRLDAFLATVSPPLQRLLTNRNPIHHKGDPLSR